MRTTNGSLLAIVWLTACSSVGQNVSDSGETQCVEWRWYTDQDDDGYGDAATSRMACEQPEYFVDNADDCDDDDGSIHPGAEEVCDGVDQDCDGEVDDGLYFATFYPDRDGDGAAEPCCDPPYPAGAVDELWFYDVATGPNC